MVTPLALIVREGPDAGMRVEAREEMITIGRARGNDLLLRDPAVSRRHLEARAHEGHLLVRAADGAAPFVVRGESLREARLAPGDALLVGDTWLVVVRGEAIRRPAAVTDTLESPGRSSSSPPGATQRTDVRTLFDGASSEVRGLSALFQLTEALDQSRSEADTEEAFRAFLLDHIRGAEATFDVQDPSSPEPFTGRATSGQATSGQATSGQATSGQATSGYATLLPTSGPPAEALPATVPPIPAAAAVVEHSSGEATTIVLPTGVLSPAHIAVRIPQSSILGNQLRRLLVVAARVFGSRVEQVRALTTAREESEQLRTMALGSARAFLGTSKAAEHVARVVPRLAASDTVALLLGESGVGKTFVARLIHEQSPRAAAPLRVINCAAIPENLLEAELFGAERGAFTGAVAAREGAFESAGTGTLLLDEIGELGLTGQAKLLRALEEKRFERLGSNRSILLRARVLAATNRDLAAMVDQGTFRRDLFFRISVITLRIPALRERGDDIRLLAERILSDLLPGCARRVRGLSPAALASISSYSWPGNVRELRNALEHALVLGDGPWIEPSDLPETMAVPNPPPPPAEEAPVARLPMRLDDLEELDIRAALAATNGNRTRAAALLGINRVTLYKKLREDPPT